MNSNDIWNMILICSVLIIVLFINYCIQLLNSSRDKWGSIKCNPILLPLSSWFGYDPRESFEKCIRKQLETKQELTPTEAEIIDDVRENINSAADTEKEIHEDVEKVSEEMDNNVRTISHISGVIGTEFERTKSNMRNTVNRIKSSMDSIYYMFIYGTNAGLGLTDPDTSPIAQMINFVDDIPIVCFHPNTPVPYQDNTVKKIKDVVIGDVLSNNTYVIATMKLLGNRILNKNSNNDLYCLYSEELRHNIFVTAHHLVEYKDEIIFVKDHPHSKHLPNELTDVLYCLVTSDHNIYIGEYIFKDWESHSII